MTVATGELTSPTIIPTRMSRPGSGEAAAAMWRKAAQGRLRLDDLAAYLDQSDGLPHGKAPLCAPADGLYLEKVIY